MSQARLTIEFEKPKLLTVPIEPNLYGQIVNNLLSNAIHYTPEGGTIRVTLEQNENGYQLDVADTGIGIPLEAQTELFQRFYRVDAARRGDGVEHSHGLGLAIVKAVALMHGGSVSAASGGGVTRVAFSVEAEPKG